ncbi:DUF3151 family protein [Streptomyces sp. NPDC058735]|uniref:DUF3151 family protein n=1 Tax=unclassified Streptomyces TaxID=2593676 RepID=UPI0036C36908
MLRRDLGRGPGLLAQKAVRLFVLRQVRRVRATEQVLVRRHASSLPLPDKPPGRLCGVSAVEPNRAFPRALHALARAAQAVGEQEEYERCSRSWRTPRRPRRRSWADDRPCT